MAAAEAHCASFSSFNVTVDDVLEQDAVLFLHRLTERSLAGCEKSHGEVLGCIKAQLSLVMIWATDLC